jgi:hypothetical protein
MSMKTILMAWELGGGHPMRLRPLAQTLIEAGVPGLADPLKSAMHALMRSIGAELVYAQRSTDSTIATYRYRLDVNHIGLTRLLSRWGEIVIRFEKPPGADSNPALERVVALMPEMLDPGRPGWKKPAQERLCPPPPTDAPTSEERIYGHIPATDRMLVAAGRSGSTSNLAGVQE